MDIEAIEAMLKMEGDMLTITIMPTNGKVSNWTWVRFSNSMGKISCNASSNILFNIFNKMFYT